MGGGHVRSPRSPGQATFAHSHRIGFSLENISTHPRGSRRHRTDRAHRVPDGLPRLAMQATQVAGELRIQPGKGCEPSRHRARRQLRPQSRPAPSLGARSDATRRSCRTWRSPRPDRCRPLRCTHKGRMRPPDTSFRRRTQRTRSLPWTRSAHVWDRGRSGRAEQRGGRRTCKAVPCTRDHGHQDPEDVRTDPQRPPSRGTLTGKIGPMGVETGALGLEPRTCGFGIRCSTN